MSTARPRTFVLIPGAGGAAWYWHRVVPLLVAAGHVAVAVDLPGDDENAGIDAYADLVVRAIEAHTGVILVAQSLGGFTAAAACARVPVQGLVFVNAMIPEPGEKAGDWGEHTGSSPARIEAATRHGYSTDFDLETYFLHDVSAEIAAAGAPYQRPEAKISFEEPCRFERWPDVPIHVLAGREDRLFPFEFQERVAKERLGKSVTPIPGGHLAALSQPEALVAELLAV
jgi:pimeloyl-ACP methyl ester carboxylesterase